MNELDLQAAELLERTAEALEGGELTWGKGQLINDNGHVCAVGALRMIGQGNVYGSQVAPHVTLAHVLAQKQTPIIQLNGRLDFNNQRVCTMGQHLATWNDHKATGVGDVIELFKTTAKEIRNG